VTSPSAPSLDEFRFIHEVPVRFRDLDPMGHAHHSLPLMYWEEARARYWREVAGRESVETIDYVMGEFTIRFHRRILFPATLRAAVRATRLGRSSFDMAYGLWDGDGELLASGSSTQVMFDYVSGRSMALDDDTRQRIREYDDL
jgi:acyl-CoA thioester hydrolase